jgi:hypothetical protein
MILKNNFYIFIFLVCQFLLVIILFTINSDDYNNSITTFLTFDSFRYRDRAIEFCTTNPSIVDFILQYGVNYSTISIYGSLSCIDGIFTDFIVILNNMFLFSIGLYFYVKLLNKYNIQLNKRFLIAFFLFLYFTFSLMMLNKELIGFVFIFVIMYFYAEKKFLLLFLIGILFGILRLQYLPIVLLLIFLRKPHFLLILLAVNILMLLFMPPSLHLWATNRGGTDIVNSLPLMLKIEDLAYQPIIGVLGYLTRIVLSLLIGFKAPIDLLLVKELHLGTFLYLESIFLLSIFTVLYIFQYIKLQKFKNILTNNEDYKLYMANHNIAIIFLSIDSIAPYLQPRYYLPVIIIWMTNLLIYNKIKKSIRRGCDDK